MRRRPLHTRSEAIADRLLRRTLTGTGWTVIPKLPIDAVLERDADELDREAMSLYTRGHFDFAVYPDDPDEQLAAFVIEFDGFGHDRPEQVRRDILKNRFCSRASLPLLRLGPMDLRELDRSTVLEWIVQRFVAWHAESDERVRAAQEAMARATEGLDPEVAVELVQDDPTFDPSFWFDLEHPFPGNARIAERLRARWDMRVDRSVLRYADTEGPTELVLECGRGASGPRVGPVSEFVTHRRTARLRTAGAPGRVLSEHTAEASFASAHRIGAPDDLRGLLSDPRSFNPLGPFPDLKWLSDRIEVLDLRWLPGTTPNDVVEQLSLYLVLLETERWCIQNLVERGRYAS
jgi:hypothetical protein